MSDLEIINCEEFGAIQIDVRRLITDGRLVFDPRISERGYISVSLSRGQVTFRADRFVGLIPVTDRIAVRVRPRAQISNIVQMIIRSGVAPVAIPDFSRGYLPSFEVGSDPERIYCEPLIRGVERIYDYGLMKSYVRVTRPPAWRGRMLVSDTIKKHRARNVRYRGEFDYRTLSYDGVENRALMHCLQLVQKWLTSQSDRKHRDLTLRCASLISRMPPIPDAWLDVEIGAHEIARSAARLPAQYSYYREPLWVAYLLMQSTIPDVSGEGFISLDSLVVDLSKVFEAFVRTVLSEGASANSWRVIDGNRKPFSFFESDGNYSVHPDIVLVERGQPIAVLDAKYKPDPKESDRYELLSFMDTVGVTRGAFICPQRPGDNSRYLGQTKGGKEISLLRFNLAAADMEGECARFVENVAKVSSGHHDFA